jgi:phage terminase large subunit
MPKPKIPKGDYFEALGELLVPPKAPAHHVDKTWSPILNPKQQEMFEAGQKFILGWGEKGSGKTIGVLHKLVRHCYENSNAMALILVPVRSMANKGGAWDKLMSDVLPQWKDGLGLWYSQVQKDSQHNEYIWIENAQGGMSMVVLISAPHASQLRLRIRGYEPSFVFLDEATSADSSIYFEAVAAQLGRRPGVEGVQQYVAACNPEGPSNWVYQKWFVEPFDMESGEWDPEFLEIKFPIIDNERNLNPGYIDSLQKIYKYNPLEAARMLRGEWIDQPSGEALFKEIFNVTMHVRPLKEGIPDQFSRILPVKGYPIIIGMDPGAVYNAYIFMQWLWFGDRWKWVIFDEVVTIKKRVAYQDLIPIVMRKVVHWRNLVGVTKHEDMPQVWISDNSAFNQFRPGGQGSFDVRDIEKIYEANRAKYGLESIRVKQCPKFQGSVVARVRTLQTIVGKDDIVVSSGCQKVISMFNNLEGTKAKDGEPLDPEKLMTPNRSDWVHVFDALTYPILKASLEPGALQPYAGGQTLINVA